jgi:hypothetical protein
VISRQPKNEKKMVIAQPLTSGLTMRAADDGWAARFLAFFAALSLFRFDSVSQLQPIAANASRWLASLKT